MGSQVSADVRGVHVVIVGGGFGGIAAASQLQVLSVPFTLVDAKDSFHHNVAALRASVERGNGLFLGLSCWEWSSHSKGLGVVFSTSDQVPKFYH